MPCLICKKKTKKNSKLCKRHLRTYMWDSSLQGVRLKKRGPGSRYTTKKFHKTEIMLTKIIEHIYGMKNVVTSWHPVWAETDKGVLYEYDIYIPSLRLLIEYNGVQHYRYTSFFHKNEATFKKQLARDKKKKILAKENGYTLVVFKYDEPIVTGYVRGKILEKFNNGS